MGAGNKKVTVIDANLRKLRYVAFQSIRGQPDCLNVISTILKSFTQAHDRLEPWPGVNLLAGDWAFDALLASINPEGLAWFLSQRKTTYERVAFTKVWIFRGEGDDEHTPSVIWQIERATAALDHAAQGRHNQGFAIGVQKSLRTAPAGAAQAGTKRPAGVAFTPDQGNSPGSGNGGPGQSPGVGPSGSSPSPPYLDPGAPGYMPGSAAQSPNSGSQSSGVNSNVGTPGKPYLDPGAPGYWPETPQPVGQGSGGSHNSGSPGSGSGHGSSPAGSGGRA